MIWSVDQVRHYINQSRFSLISVSIEDDSNYKRVLFLVLPARDLRQK